MKSDVFEVVLSLVVQDSTMVLPEDLQDCRRALFVSLPELQVSLRLHDYFMGELDLKRRSRLLSTRVLFFES